MTTVPTDITVQGNYSGHVTNGLTGGIDFWVSQKRDTEIVPCAMGRVVRANQHLGNGWQIVIHHGLLIFTVYAHMAKIYVVKGDLVTPEDVMGVGGNTGENAQGFYHLHLSLSVPSHIKPNDPATMPFSCSGKPSLTADPGRYAEYCVKGKKVGGKRIRICNDGINYRQDEVYDRRVWERGKRFNRSFQRIVLDIKKNMPPPAWAKIWKQFGATPSSYKYEFMEKQLKRRLGGISARDADRYLEGLEKWKKEGPPILTAPILNPSKPHLHNRRFVERRRS